MSYSNVSLSAVWLCRPIFGEGYGKARCPEGGYMPYSCAYTPALLRVQWLIHVDSGICCCSVFWQKLSNLQLAIISSVSVSPPLRVFFLSLSVSIILSPFQSPLSPSVAFSPSLLPSSPSICLRGGFTNRVLDRREECRESGLFLASQLVIQG